MIRRTVSHDSFLADDQLAVKDQRITAFGCIRIRRRILGGFLAFLISVATIGLHAAAAIPLLAAADTSLTAAETRAEEPLQLSFFYDDKASAICYFTPDYFSDSALSGFHPSLATMSLALAMSSFGVKEEAAADDVTDWPEKGNAGNTASDAAYRNSFRNVKNLLMDIGIEEENIAFNEWYEKKPSTDSIGVIAGHRRMGEGDETYELIAVVVRGGGYEQEWAGNFTVGASGGHAGFEEAKESVYAFLEAYLREQKISGRVKFWITGYSRGAAVANLLAARMDKELDKGQPIAPGLTYSLEDIYAYCFETPAGALKKNALDAPRYQNIYNVLNPNDPVIYVAPAFFGFGRYGSSMILPTKDSDPEDYEAKKAAMLSIYRKLPTAGSYQVDDFQMKKLDLSIGFRGFLDGEKLIKDDTEENLTQGEFLSRYATLISFAYLRKRANYAGTYEDEIREICSVVFGCTDEQSRVLLNELINQSVRHMGRFLVKYVYNVGIRGLWVTNWKKERREALEDEAFSEISGWLLAAVEKAGITWYDEALIDAAGKDLGDLALALLTRNPSYFITLVYNGKGIAEAHYPELCFAWLASMDENYR